MEKLVITAIIVLLFNSVFGQNEIEEIKIYNSIDTVKQNCWVTKYEFEKLVDTVFYFPEKNTGIVSKHDKNGLLLTKEIFKIDRLPYPSTGLYTKEFIANDSTRIIYDGVSFGFAKLYLTERIIYYKNSVIKEIQKFKIDLADCTIVTFHPETYKEIITESKCKERIRTGIWEYFDEYGNPLKKEKY